MTDDVMSLEDAAEAFADAQTEMTDQPQQPDPPGPTASVVSTPALIYTKFSERAFVVEEVERWAYTPTGVFATGAWENDPPDLVRNISIPYTEIKYIELDFASEEEQARQAYEAGREETRDESSSD